MFPKGVIYQDGESQHYGVVRVAVPLHLKIIFGLFRGIGAGIIGFAVISLIFTYGPIVKEEWNYAFQQKSVTSAFGKLIDLALGDNVVRTQEEARNLGINSYFSVYVPKINAKSIVVANVDAANEKEYLEALKEGIAHAKGTFFPGQGRNIFLFAHSTDSPVNIARYNATFYLLGKLVKGDKITVYFADKKYEYLVTDKVITKPNDTSWLKENVGERLILQTCDPPGTTWNRLLVIAKPIS